MLAPIVRIGLRYVAGILVAKGLADPETASWLATDPDIINGVQIAAGVAIAVVSEGWYYLARKLGWAK